MLGKVVLLVNLGEVVGVHDFGPGEDGGEEEEKTVEGLVGGEVVVEAVLLGDDDGRRGARGACEEDGGAAIAAVQVPLGEAVHETRSGGDLDEEEDEGAQRRDPSCCGGGDRLLGRGDLEGLRLGSSVAEAGLFVVEVVVVRSPRRRLGLPFFGRRVLGRLLERTWRRRRRRRRLTTTTSGSGSGDGQVRSREAEGQGSRALSEEPRALADPPPVGVFLGVVAAVRA
mmetsp:Transcript_35835/g.114792  ORF Transcript_35835/g.114792 Transcript_35835/m.114792 type:complete len:227 (+) Transcript_35835:441-1121(+)